MTKIRNLLPYLIKITVVLLLYFGGAEAAKTIQWDDAHHHVGETVTVEGVFKYTNNIGSICFLNFHPNFKKYLSVLIFKDYFSLFPKQPEAHYYLKKVRVHGKITTYKNKPQIKVYDPRQIEIIGEYTRPTDTTPCKCEYPKQLEITSINIGQGDATLIATPTKIMLADAGESYWYSNADALKIDSVIRSKYGENCRRIDYVLISHFHLDHIGYIFIPETPDDIPLNSDLKPLKIGQSPYKPIGYGGLGYLVFEMGYKIDKMIVRDYSHHNPNKSPKNGGSKTFRNWQIVLESEEGKELFHSEMVRLGNEQIQLGAIENTPVVIDIISADGATTSYATGCDPGRFFGGPDFTVRGITSSEEIPPSENDLSISFVLSYGKFQMFIGGDLSGENHMSGFGYRYHDMEHCLASDPYIVKTHGKQVDVFRANHHGSSHSNNSEILEMLGPTVTIFSVGDHNAYGHVNAEVINRVRKFSKSIFLTECGDNIVSKMQAEAMAITVVDNEYPVKLEETEFEDPNIDILVSPNGDKYYVEGVEFISH